MVMGVCRGIPSNQSLVVGRDSHRFKDRMGLPLCFTPPSRRHASRENHPPTVSDGWRVSDISEACSALPPVTAPHPPPLQCVVSLPVVPVVARLATSSSSVRSILCTTPTFSASSSWRQSMSGGAALGAVMRHTTMISMHPSKASSRRTPSNSLQRLLVQWSTPRANHTGRRQSCTTTRCPPLLLPRGTTWTVTRLRWHTFMLGARMIARLRWAAFTSLRGVDVPRLGPAMLWFMLPVPLATVQPVTTKNELRHQNI
jgi:hypothetical protein